MRRIITVALAACLFVVSVPAMAFAELTGSGITLEPEVGTHADAPPPVDGAYGGMETTLEGRNGSNGITFGGFVSGDLVVVLGTVTGHAGLFDRARYTSGIYSYAVWSANTRPVNGVQRERCAKYRLYDRAFCLWVPSRYWFGPAARDYCLRQAGEPYSLASSKADQSRWYCSKLCWSAWYRTALVDLDADGGYWVWPVDLVRDRQTAVKGYWG